MLPQNILIIITFLMFMGHATASTSMAGKSASRVEIRQDKQGYSFYVNNQRFNVNGVGLNYNYGHKFKELSEAGGNAFRTWTTENLDLELKAAEKYNLMVAVGVHVAFERNGFDFDDKAAYKQAIETIKKTIDKYKDHPNILCWIIGNEVNLYFTKNGLKMVNPKSYQMLTEIFEYIKRVDPNHPVSFSLGGFRVADVKHALKHTKGYDFLSFQLYDELWKVYELRKLAGAANIPFMVTEHGPTGFWESQFTPWGREIEENSTRKASYMIHKMQMTFKRWNDGYFLGDFVFVWGDKLESTPTWYGMFLDSGEKTSRVDEITKYWTGKYPENRSPAVVHMDLNGLIAEQYVVLKPGEKAVGRVIAKDPEKDKLKYRWELLVEPSSRHLDGAEIDELRVLNKSNGSESKSKFYFEAPLKEGEYRLYVYVSDTNNSAGYANIPFKVEQIKLVK